MLWFRSFSFLLGSVGTTAAFVVPLSIPQKTPRVKSLTLPYIPNERDSETTQSFSTEELNQRLKDAANNIQAQDVPLSEEDMRQILINHEEAANKIQAQQHQQLRTRLEQEFGMPLSEEDMRLSVAWSEPLSFSNNWYGEIDMSGFESSYKGLTNPSKAMLALAIVLASGMVVTAPDLDIPSMMTTTGSMIDWNVMDFTAPQWDVDLSRMMATSSLTSFPQNAHDTFQNAFESLQSQAIIPIQSTVSSWWSNLQNQAVPDAGAALFNLVSQVQDSTVAATLQMQQAATQVQDSTGAFSRTFGSQLQDSVLGMSSQASYEMQQAASQIQDSTEAFSRTIRPQLQDSVWGAAALIQQTSSHIQQAASQIHDSTEAYSRTFGPQLQESVGGIVSHVKQGTSQIQQAASQIQDSTEAFSRTIRPQLQDSVWGAAALIQQTSSHIQQAASQIHDSTEAYSRTFGPQLQESVGGIVSHVKQGTSQIQQSASQIQESTEAFSRTLGSQLQDSAGGMVSHFEQVVPKKAPAMELPPLEFSKISMELPLQLELPKISMELPLRLDLPNNVPPSPPSISASSSLVDTNLWIPAPTQADDVYDRLQEALWASQKYY